nr:zinc finger, CCHC-type, retrotransposon Gag domain protein [Tanacetum cinerariifolium]
SERLADIASPDSRRDSRGVPYQFWTVEFWWKSSTAAGTVEEQAKNFQWGLRKSTLNHLMCIPFIDVAQVANAARNYEILHERD